MAFIPEDGTGLPDANSYSDVATADAYWADRANATWGAALSAAKQAALVEATTYIDLRFGPGVPGEPVSEAQALVFPRTGLPACARGEELPSRVLQATAEYALRALAGPLAPDPVVDATGRAQTGRRVKVGPIEKEDTFAAGVGGVPAWRPYPVPDALMGCLAPLRLHAGQSRTMRA